MEELIKDFEEFRKICLEYGAFQLRESLEYVTLGVIGYLPIIVLNFFL